MNSFESMAVLVLDDEIRLADEIGEYLESKGFSVFIADRPSKAFQILHSKPIHIAMVDIKLPEYDGLTFLRKLRAEQSETEIIIMSGHGDMESVIEALRLGAFDYLRKPFSSLELQAAISRISRFLEVQRNYRRSAQRCVELQNELCSENELIGHSPVMEQIRETIQRAAQFPETAVLIRGESGTGKELVARQIHRLSDRADGSFVPVNCAAIPRDMFESEFFGHEKGAFTDAQIKRNGLFRTADGGTLFLDEIGEIPLELQSKLLRALEEKKVRPLGMDKELSADVRIIGATNRDLLEEVRQGRFRKDLYYRIAVMDIYIPPLRERREDIADLFDYFYRQSYLRSGRPFRPINASIIDQLSRYNFPGNIRELKNLVERIVILGREPHEKDLSTWLDPEHCGCSQENQSQTGDPLSDLPPVLDLETVERALIMRAMEKAQGVQSTAAQLLGITRQALDRRLKKYNLRLFEK